MTRTSKTYTSTNGSASITYQVTTWESGTMTVTLPGGTTFNAETQEEINEIITMKLNATRYHGYATI